MYHRQQSLERSFEQFIKWSLNRSLNRLLKPSHERWLEQTSFLFFSKTYFLTRHKIKLSQKNANISKNNNPSFYDILMDLSYVSKFETWSMIWSRFSKIDSLLFWIIDFWKLPTMMSNVSTPMSSSSWKPRVIKTWEQLAPQARAVVSAANFIFSRGWGSDHVRCRHKQSWAQQTMCFCVVEGPIAGKSGRERSELYFSGAQPWAP